MTSSITPLWNLMTKNGYRFLLLISFFFFAFTGHAQNATGLRAAKKQPVSNIASSTNTLVEANQKDGNVTESILEQFKGKKEDISKRDAYSKHFANANGSYTAAISVLPIHYKKGSNYEDINTSITNNISSDYSYANKTNIFESYFGQTSEVGVKNQTSEGEIKEFLNTKMYWEVNGQAVNTIQSNNVAVTIQQNKAYYNNLYENISAEFSIESGRRKLNYIIPNRGILRNIPTNATYLVFAEDVVLPNGWSYKADNKKGVLIFNQDGKEVFQYENPVSTDATNELSQEQNTVFQTSLNENILTINTKVKTSWLLSTQRQFPIKVDPTFTQLIGNSAERGYCTSAGAGTYNTVRFGYNPSVWNLAYVSYNLAAFNASWVTSDVSLVLSGSSSGTIHASASEIIQRVTINPADYGTWASYYTAQNGMAAYNTYVGAGNMAGTKNLGAAAVTQFTSDVGTAYKKFTVGFKAGGTWNINSFVAWTTATLNVTYTIPTGPPACATAIGPADGATAVAHQGLLSWNAVGGATSYDVYFGTNSTPAIVSTGQTGTTYNPGGCLLPNTQYYWRVIGKNASGSATGCATWSFTTDGKLNIYKNDWETASVGIFATSGTSVDGWFTNNNSTNQYGETNTWTVGTGENAISGKSVGVTALLNNGLAGSFFQYYSNLGELHRWIYRPFDMRGLRDIEVTFRWKAGGENNQDYGSVITSINSGANWVTDTQGGLLNDGRYWNSPSTIRTQSITLPATRNNQQNFVLGFKWDDMSGNGYSLDPTFVVDDIVIKACPSEGTINSNVVGAGIFEWTPTASTQATLTINGSHTCAQYQWEQSTDEGISWTNAVGGSGATTVSYITPSALTVTTWYRAKVYFGTGCTGVYQDAPFKIISPCTAAITSVVNGFGCTTVNLEAVGASGTVNYLWYDAATAGNLLDTTTSGTWTTPVLTASKTYYVSAYNGICESPRVAVTATLTPTAAVIDIVQGAASCSTGPVTLYAVTSDDSLYTANWYDAETGGQLVHTGFEYTFTPTASVTFYVAAAEGACESTREPVSVELLSKVWNGSVDTNWSNPANWTPTGTPDLTNCVVIPEVANLPIINGNHNALAKTLTLDANAALLVESGSNIKVVNEVAVGNNANFTLQNDAYLIQTQNVATNDNSGSITVNRHSTPMFRLEATGWSSPVESQNLYGFAIGTVAGRIYEYDEAANAFSNTNITTASTFVAGKGYSIRSSNLYPDYTVGGTPVTFEGIFKGKPQNGNIGINITATNKGYNYVGNPYPSPIDAAAFLDLNQSIESLHFWTHEAPPINGVYAANNYASFSSIGGTQAAAGGSAPDGIIQVGQGFIAKTTQTYLLQFTNDLRLTSSNGQFFKTQTQERHRMWLNLSDETTAYNQILVGYTENATMAADHQIDAKLFGYSGNSIYTLIDDTKYVIQGRSLPFVTSDVVPVGFKAIAAGMFTIGINHVDGIFAEGQIIYLKDKLTNTTHNLSEGNYSFATEAGTFNERFEIVYTNTVLGIDQNAAQANNWFASKKDKTILVKSKGFDIQSVEIFDLTGRLLLRKDKVNAKEFSCPANFADQMLLVKINKTMTKKVL